MPEQSELLKAYRAFLEQVENKEEKQRFQPFFDAVKAADDAMSALSRPDQYGRLPLLNAEKKEQLLRLHQALGEAAEALLKDETLPEARKDAVKKLSALGADNYRHLLRWDPKKPCSLPELLADARTLTLDTRGLTLDAAFKGNQSKRQPLTFLDDNNQEVTGVFTPKKHSDAWASIDETMRMTAQHQHMPEDCRPYFTDFMTMLDTPKGAEILGLDPKADRKAKLEALYIRAHVGLKAGRDKEALKIISELFSTPENKVTPEDLGKKLEVEEALALSSALAAAGTRILNNQMIAKIHDGARMDSRNAAMSAVADLLNVPELLARSVPMRVVDKDGQVVEGTFMRKAKGYDFRNLSSEAAGLGGNAALIRHDGRALKSIADLQVLDYICGNTDRHPGNVTYIFDSNDKFIGVQGFDNDTAFGAIRPKMGDFVAFLTMPENMKCISQTMYDRLCQITPEMLKFTLRGYDLTEDELDAATERLQAVKDAVQRSKDTRQKQAPEQNAQEKKPGAQLSPTARLVLVKEGEWKKIPIPNLYAKKYKYKRYQGGRLKEQEGPGNLFVGCIETVKNFSAPLRDPNHQYRPLRGGDTVGVNNRAKPRGVEGQMQKARELWDMLDKRSKLFQSSPEYRRMEKAVENYRSFQEKLLNRIEKAQEAQERLDSSRLTQKNEKKLMVSMDAVITVDDLMEMQRLGREIRDSAQIYLDKKGDGKYETYTRKRIDAAKEVKKFGEAVSKVSETELDTAARNQRRAQEKISRGFGDLLERTNWQPEPPQAKAPQPAQPAAGPAPQLGGH